MRREKTKTDLHPDKYEITRDAVLQILAEYQDGINIDRLAKKASESLATDRSFSSGEIKKYVQRVVFDLKGASVVEDVPDTRRTEIRVLAEGREALMDATRRGHIAVVKRLLSSGIEADAKNAALISSVINNQTEIVRLLIEAGADVTARELVFGRTPLMYVTSRTRKDIEILLRAAGAQE